MSKNDQIFKNKDDYKYGFSDGDLSIFNTGQGLNEDVVRTISKLKNEPEWMLNYRLDSLKKFNEMPLQDWGPDLSHIDFDEFTYFNRVAEKESNDWNEVPETVKNTFDKLGIPEAEQKFLSGVTTQYDSEAVYHNMLDEVREKGVIFLDTDSALKQCPELFKQYFGTLVPNSDNKFAALNGAVWSRGKFYLCT